MKLLADENFPAPVSTILRQRDNHVLSIAEFMPGATDHQVLDAAVSSGRLLLTLDRDFGDLIFHQHRPRPAGVILFRLTGSTPAQDNRRMTAVLEHVEEFVGAFTTVTDTLIRSRPLPP